LERQSHAVLDRSARIIKGRKIATILRASRVAGPNKVLDVGTGGGYIAEYFADMVGNGGRVMATDMINQLPHDSQVEFRTSEGTFLPFESAEFDLVISNHVIEHVGAAEDQLNHLMEMARVVKAGGTIYLATPNRWTMFEPHFRLPFLSWLPEPARSAYVRVTGRGGIYDCTPLTRPQLKRLSEQAGLKGTDVTHLALRHYGDIEMGGLAGRSLAAIPESVARLIAGMWCIPSLVFLFTPSERRGT